MDVLTGNEQNSKKKELLREKTLLFFFFKALLDRTGFAFKAVLMVDC